MTHCIYSKIQMEEMDAWSGPLERDLFTKHGIVKHLTPLQIFHYSFLAAFLTLFQWNIVMRVKNECGTLAVCFVLLQSLKPQLQKTFQLNFSPLLNWRHINTHSLLISSISLRWTLRTNVQTFVLRVVTGVIPSKGHLFTPLWFIAVPKWYILHYSKKICTF